MLREVIALATALRDRILQVPPVSYVDSYDSPHEKFWFSLVKMKAAVKLW